MAQEGEEAREGESCVKEQQESNLEWEQKDRQHLARLSGRRERRSQWLLVDLVQSGSPLSLSLALISALLGTNITHVCLVHLPVYEITHYFPALALPLRLRLF